MADRPHFVISDPDRARENLGKEELKIYHLQRVVLLRMTAPSKTRKNKDIMMVPAILTDFGIVLYGVSTTMIGVMTLIIAGVLIGIGDHAVEANRNQAEDQTCL